MNHRAQKIRAFAPILLAVTAGSALFGAPAQAAHKPLAAEPGSAGFQAGKPYSPKASKASSALLYNGGTQPGEEPITVMPPVIGADLLIGLAVSNLTLKGQLASRRPVETDALIAKTTATKAATYVSDLRSKIRYIADQYRLSPTLENSGNNNRGRLVCTFGGAEWCGNPWCALFASSVWRMSGVRAMPITPAVKSLVAWAMKHKRWRNAKSTPGVGDIVAFGCTKSLDFCEHTGLIIGSTKSTLQTIEGNTQTPFSGRQGVAARERTRNSWISGFVSLG